MSLMQPAKGAGEGRPRDEAPVPLSPILQSIDGDQEKLRLAAEYWRRRPDGSWDVPVSTLAPRGYIGPLPLSSHLAFSVKATLPGLVCTRCSGPIDARSRSEADQLQRIPVSKAKFACEACRSLQKEAALAAERQNVQALVDKRCQEVEALRHQHKPPAHIDDVPLFECLALVGLAKCAPAGAIRAGSGAFGVFPTDQLAKFGLASLHRAGLLVPEKAQPEYIQQSPSTTIKVGELRFEQPDAGLVAAAAERLGRAGAASRGRTCADWPDDLLALGSMLVRIDLAAHLQAQIALMRHGSVSAWSDAIDDLLAERAYTVPLPVLRAMVKASVRWVSSAANSYRASGAALDTYLLRGLERNLAWFDEGTFRAQPVMEPAYPSWLSAQFAQTFGRPLEALVGDKARETIRTRPGTNPLHEELVGALHNALAQNLLSDDRCKALLQELRDAGL